MPGSSVLREPERNSRVAPKGILMEIQKWSCPIPPTGNAAEAEKDPQTALLRFLLGLLLALGLTFWPNHIPARLLELHPCSIKPERTQHGVLEYFQNAQHLGEAHPEGTGESPTPCPPHHFLCILCNMLHSSPRNKIPYSPRRVTGIPTAKQSILNTRWVGVIPSCDSHLRWGRRGHPVGPQPQPVRRDTVFMTD